MYLVIAVLLAIAYAVVLVLVYTVPIVTHVLILLAIGSLVLHLLHGRRVQTQESPA